MTTASATSGSSSALAGSRPSVRLRRRPPRRGRSASSARPATWTAPPAGRSRRRSSNGTPVRTGRFSVGSAETGPPEGDNVAFHEFRFRSRSPGFNDAVLPFQRIRCDSAEYFQIFGQRRPKACIFDDVLPYLTYSLNDPRVSQIAGHIWWAQRFPTVTFPLKPGLDPKSIPGTYPGPDGEGPGLHRIRRGETTRANRAEVRRACRRQAPYEETGLPRPPRPGQHCDEFPFASTLEGAASPRWDFSVRAVDARQNCSAGGLLNHYLTSDRILYDQDEYYVRIAGNGPPPQDPPIFDPPNDGSDDECSIG